MVRPNPVERRACRKGDALDARRRALVIEATHARIREAARRYGVVLESVPVSFDLFGVSAGLYQRAGKQCRIRYNPLIFDHYFNDNLRGTVAHEVAHYVVDRLHGRRGVKPHGHQWRAVMADFGVAAQVGHHWNLDALGVRRQRRFDYRCACGEHQVTTVRHRRMRDQRAVYLCRRCGEALKPAFDRDSSG